jgi:alpha-1,3-rhamnosyl/mannosyltransferase
MAVSADTYGGGHLTIGIDGRFLQDKFHGIGRYLYGLLTGLCSLHGDHRVILFVDPDLPNRRFPLERLAGTGKLELRSIALPLYSPRELYGWPRALCSAQVDVFHAPYIWSPLVLPCPLVTTFHDMIFDRYPEYMPGRRFWLPYKLMSRLALLKSQRVIAVSDATRSDIIAFTGTRPDKIVTVLSGVEESFKPVAGGAGRESVRARYGLPESFILALGARRPHKNIGRLVAAFGRIAGEVRHTLVLVGDIDARFDDEAARRIAGLKAEGRLFEIGFVAEQDLPALYSLADLFVQPSIIEGFGLPVVEAMACGCPVACSNTSSLPEVAGDAALFFDPLSEDDIARALRGALASAPARADMVQRGLRRARRLTWQSAAAQTLDVYRDAAGAPKRESGLFTAYPPDRR